MAQFAFVGVQLETTNMSIKFALVFLAIFAYQGAFASPAKVSTYGLVEQIGEAIEKLKVAIQGAIDKAVEGLSNLFDKIVEKGNQLIEQIKVNINDIVNGAKKEIQKLVDEAKELGVDVQECVKDSNEDLQNLAEGLVNSALKCVTDKVDEAKGIVLGAIEEIKDYVNVIGGLEEDVKKCGTGLGAIKCLGEVLSDVIKATTSLPVEISKKVAQITALISTLEAAMVQCATNIGIDAAGEVGSIVIEVGECIAKKITDSQQ